MILSIPRTPPSSSPLDAVLVSNPSLFAGQGLPQQVDALSHDQSISPDQQAYLKRLRREAVLNAQQADVPSRRQSISPDQQAYLKRLRREATFSGQQLAPQVQNRLRTASGNVPATLTQQKGVRPPRLPKQPRLDRNGNIDIVTAASAEPALVSQPSIDFNTAFGGKLRPQRPEKQGRPPRPERGVQIITDCTEKGTFAMTLGKLQH